MQESKLPWLLGQPYAALNRVGYWEMTGVWHRHAAGNYSRVESRQDSLVTVVCSFGKDFTDFPQCLMRQEDLVTILRSFEQQLIGGSWLSPRTISLVFMIKCEHAKKKKDQPIAASLWETNKAIKSPFKKLAGLWLLDLVQNQERRRVKCKASYSWR